MRRRKVPWQTHDGAEGEQCPPGRRGQRIQVRPIGSNQCFVKRGWQVDWSQRFEWRMA